MNGRTRTIALSGVLFVGIFWLRLVIMDPDDGILFLMVVPIALLALEFRLAGGIVGAALACLALIGWIGINDIDLGVIGLTTRLVCFVVAATGTGLLAQQASDRTERLRELEDREARHHTALRLNEDILQDLAVAKMGLEMGDQERASSAVLSALRGAQAIVSEGLDAEKGDFRAP